jgi:pyridoxamine 5'-phosphate oxidase family protein
MTFTPQEIAYIGSQPIARLATVAPDGQPDVVPVGFEFDGTSFYIGGMNPDRTRRTLNIQGGNDKIALVIDDVTTEAGWAPRFLRVYGTAEVVERDTPQGAQLHLKLTPSLSWSWNLDGRPMAEAGSLATRRTVH